MALSHLLALLYMSRFTNIKLLIVYMGRHKFNLVYILMSQQTPSKICLEPKWRAPFASFLYLLKLNRFVDLVCARSHGREMDLSSASNLLRNFDSLAIVHGTKGDTSLDM